MDLARLLQDPAMIEQLPEADLAEAIGALESLKARLLARLIGNPRGDKIPALAEPDTSLTAKQAAPLLNVTPHWLYPPMPEAGTTGKRR